MLTESDTLRLRPARADDERFLHELYADRRAPELASLGWDEQTRKAFVDQQFGAQQRGYGTDFPDADHWLVLAGGLAVGRILVARGADELRVVDLVILTAHRGRGIGTALMGEVQRDGADAGVPVRLTVAAYDPGVVNWYERLGFSITERRELDLAMTWHPDANRGGD